MTPEEMVRRVSYVQMLLPLETADQRVIIQWASPAWWAKRRGVTDDPDHHALGFTPPYPLGDSLVLMACAEVLVATTEQLRDLDFFGYLASVRTHLHLHIVALEHDLPPDLAEVDVLHEQRNRRDLDWSTFEAVRTRALEAPQ